MVPRLRCQPGHHHACVVHATRVRSKGGGGGVGKGILSGTALVPGSQVVDRWGVRRTWSSAVSDRPHRRAEDMGEATGATGSRTAISGEGAPTGMSRQLAAPAVRPADAAPRRPTDPPSAARPGRRPPRTAGPGDRLWHRHPAADGQADPAGATVVGVDPDLAALARAQRKGRRRGLAVQLDRGYADELPYPDHSVDVVLSSFMLHHVPADRREPAMREVRRAWVRAVCCTWWTSTGRPPPPTAGSPAGPTGSSSPRRTSAIPDLLRRAGFVDVSETGSDVRRHVGRFTFYRAVV